MSEVMSEMSRDRARTGSMRMQTDEAAVAATVAAIFSRVLRYPGVSKHDDFFDLGGDSILALALMADILQQTGQELPLTTIYDAPTPAAMAALLAAGAPPRTSCLVRLKPGHGTPLFIVHGLGGAVMELRDLGRRLEIDGAVYGIEARGLDGRQAPLDRVEEMARVHIEEIRRVQPSGPYQLAGFSFGGLVALEMAQQLTRAGETVTFLCLMDTYPHSSRWPLHIRVLTWLRLSGFWLSPTLWRTLVRHYGGVLRGLPPRQRWAFITNRARRAGGILFNIFGAADRANIFLRHAAEQSTPQPAERPEILRVHSASKAALAAYRPTAYAGKTLFIQAADEELLPSNPHAMWRLLRPGLTVHAMSGDHLALVRGNVAHLAQFLSAALQHAAAPTAPASGRAR